MSNYLIRALPVGAVLVAVLSAPSMAEVIDGTPGPDRLFGTSKADTIHGYAGNDGLYGGSGLDRMYGGKGADQLYGGRGPDRLYGRRGADRLFGGSDVQGSAGEGSCLRPGCPGKAARLYGGPGNDRIVGREHDGVYAGRGNDVIVFTLPRPTVISCGPGDDLIIWKQLGMQAWGMQVRGCERERTAFTH